jgi:peptidoglycan/xylan/chitin deacetylase (PgdA/CDA1 family)/glycosyltransferase involved in cell wall biosynthesis
MRNSSSFGAPLSLRFSVIVPTYQRRDLVLALVRSLGRQEFDGSFEAIVVVDGSVDATAEAVRKIGTNFPLTVLEQENRGAAAARNRGASIARGEILLFLDDDMEAHPQLLTEHDRSHKQGADVVVGHIPLHQEAASNILTAAVKGWADDRARRLTSPGASLTIHDILTGQLSLTNKLFHSAGGFDASFTQGGSFGDEDIDFGHRLSQAGYRVVFNPNAISWQNYVVGPRQYLRQWRQTGHADVAFARKHPDQASTIFALNESDTRINRWLWRPLVALPFLTGPLMIAFRWLVLTLVERGAQSAAAARLFFELRSMEYWRGVSEAGGMPRPRPLRVLAYHAIKDLAEAPVVESYAVPPELFCRQLDLLRRAGFQFVSADEFLHFLHEGGGLPRRPLLLTFDDCYAELLDVVMPLLKERAIPAVAFAVSGLIGRTNQWDEAIGAPRLQLADASGLRELAGQGIEIGAHSRTHRPLTRISDDEISDEVMGSVADLEAAGLARPRMFAYPEGENNLKAQRAAAAAGLKAAFTVIAGLVRPGQDPYQVPRIEILRADAGLKFLWKVALAGRTAKLINSLRFMSHVRRRRPSKTSRLSTQEHLSYK